MGQIVSSAAKPKRCNANQLSQVPTPAAGEYILVSSDNSMNAAGQGNFDCYIMGDGTTAATALPLNKINADIIALVEDVESNIVDKTVFTLQWTDNRLLRINGGVTTISEGAAQYNRCAATEKVECANYVGKTFAITHGVITGDKTEFIFYNGNTGITTSYVEYDGSGTANVVVPENATHFRVGVYVALNGGVLADGKNAASVTYSQFLLVKKSDIADNLTTDDAAKVLSAKQGKLLKDTLDVVQEDVNEIMSNVADSVSFPIVWNDHQLLRNNGGVTTISDTSAVQYNKVACSDQIPCSDYQGETLLISHGGTGAGPTMIIFYNVNAGLTDTYAEYTGEGTEVVEVPSNATSLRIGVYCSTDSQLEGSKAAANVGYEEISILKESDIADNLTTEDATKVLSAKQGKILGEKVSQLIHEETYNFPITWVDNRLIQANGTVVDISQEGYLNRYATTEQIPCTDFVGQELQITYGVEKTFLAFYNSANHLVGTAYTQFTGTGIGTAMIPANAIYFLLCISVNASGVNYTESKAAVSAWVTYSVKTSDTTKPKLFSQKLFGAIDYAMPTDFDYSQLLFFGQSFAQGGSSAPVTTGVIPNCYMFGDNVKARTGAAFNPLQLRTDVSEPYEYPVVSCANALSRMYRRYTHDINIVASTAGTSGASLQTLITSYIPNVVQMHQNMKSVADSENKSVGCFAIVFMQGESDYGGRDNSTPDKDDYKALLLQTKNALQASAMTNLGQDRKPLFFIYQTSGGWVHDYTGIDNSALGVSMAQIEFAQENDDVVLISPCYQVTTYTDNHPSCNGYRWLGEYYAKAIWQTLYRGWRFSNPIPKEFVREDNRIIIYISSCILPLKFDTWTLPRQTNYGFKVTADGTEVGITDIALEDNAIVLTLSGSIASATSVKVTYGGVGVGRGNICDSDTWSTWLKYLSDANDTGYDGNRVIGQSPTAKGGGSLVGQNYPMNNFLSIFYKEFVSE